MKSRMAASSTSRGVGKASDRVPAYGGGRVCEEPGCDTVLSTYNPASYCALHDPAHPAPAR